MATLTKEQKDRLKTTQKYFDEMTEAKRKKNLKMLISNYCKCDDEDQIVFETFAKRNNINLPQIH